jgi:hypothetical protein
MNKKIIGLVSRTGIYLVIGMVFFLELVNFIQFPTIQSPSIQEKQFSLEKIENEVNKSVMLIQKYQAESINSELVNRLNIKDEQNLSNIELVENSKWNLSLWLKEQYIFFDYLFYNNNNNNNNAVVPFLYALTLLTFLVQVLLLSLSNYYDLLLNFFNEKKLDTIFLYSSEWAVNAPPVLGVIGTIFSFGMVVSNLSDLSSLSTVFKDNFANAALTTIIGGSIYVINLLMNIFIAKNLSK